MVGLKAVREEWESPLNSFTCSYGKEKTSLEVPAHRVLPQCGDWSQEEENVMKEK